MCLGCSWLDCGDGGAVAPWELVSSGYSSFRVAFLSWLAFGWFSSNLCGLINGVIVLPSPGLLTGACLAGSHSNALPAGTPSVGDNFLRGFDGVRPSEDKTR